MIFRYEPIIEPFAVYEYTMPRQSPEDIEVKPEELVEDNGDEDWVEDDREIDVKDIIKDADRANRIVL